MLKGWEVCAGIFCGYRAFAKFLFFKELVLGLFGFILSEVAVFILLLDIWRFDNYIMSRRGCAR
jgi:hypothetical protein